MNSTILTFSGPINAGKTSLSERIACQLNWKRTGFGDCVHGIAKQKGVEDSRENLQRIGKEEIEQNCENFCISVLSMANWTKGENLIVDGIRHKEALDSLKKITNPSKVRLIHIELDLENRKRRGENLESELERYDSHPTEEQVVSVLPELADLIIDGSKTVEENVSEILEWLKSDAD